MRQDQEPNKIQSRLDPEWFIHYLWVIWAQAPVEAGEPVFPDMALPWTYKPSSEIYRRNPLQGSHPGASKPHDHNQSNHFFNTLITRWRTLTSKAVVTR